MAYSTDGRTWTAVEGSSTGYFPDTIIYSIAYGNGRFVAGGSGGILAYCDW